MTVETTADASSGATASSSSFYAAMRILPRAQREAMFQIYTFCRYVDDIADSDNPRPERLAALQQWRDDIDALYQGSAPERLRDYAISVRDFGLRREDFLAVIDGMEMDVLADIRAPDDATLDLYCDRVASAVGRLYLPREGLLSAGISSFDPAAVISNPALPRVCAPLVERAQAHFVESDEIMNRNPRRAVRAPRIMSRYYHAILEMLEHRGFQAPRSPVHVSQAAKIAIVLRYALI
jgi:phytoene synthase